MQSGLNPDSPIHLFNPDSNGSIGFSGGVATVKRLRIHTIALWLRNGALTVEYFRAHGFYEWLAISTGNYWSSEELKALLGDLGRNECKLSMRTRKLCPKKLYYTAALH